MTASHASLGPARVAACALSILAVMTAGSACVSSSSVDARTRPPTADDTADLRIKAELDHCPTGISHELPNLRLPCLGGGPTVVVQKAPGSALLVNFYNTTCPPCQDEFPLLAEYTKQAGAIALLGVDAEDRTSDALHFVRDFGAHWPVVEDPDGRLFRQFAGGWPVTVAIKPDGSVAGTPHVGAFHDVAEIQRYVATSLAS